MQSVGQILIGDQYCAGTNAPESVVMQLMLFAASIGVPVTRVRLYIALDEGGAFVNEDKGKFTWPRDIGPGL